MTTLVFDDQFFDETNLVATWFDDESDASTTATFDPATLALTGWWRASYAGSPWTPTASGGSSGSNGNLTEGTNPPATGAAVGTSVYTSADFDGTNDQLANANTIGTFVLGTAWSVSFLLYANSAVADPGAGLRSSAAPCLLYDSNVYFVIAYTDSGVTLEMADGIGAASTLTVACSTGAWHHVQASYDGTDLWLRVDAGTASTETYGNVGLTTGTVVVGTNYAAANYFDGEIAELMIIDSTLSQAQFDSVDTYYQARYFASGTSAINGTAAMVFGQVGSAKGTGTLAGTSPMVFGQVGSAKGAGTLAGTSPMVFGQSGNILGLAVVTSATAALTFGQSGSARGTGTLVGTSPLVFGQTGSAKGAGTLAGTSPMVFGQTGSISANSFINGTAAITFGQSGTLLGAAAINGTSPMVFAVSGIGLANFAVPPDTVVLRSTVSKVTRLSTVVQAKVRLSTQVQKKTELDASVSKVVRLNTSVSKATGQ